MRKLKLFFACLLMAVLSIGQMWGTVVSGTAYDIKGNSLPANWTGTNTWSGTSTTSYFLLTQAANYVQTEEFCQNGFTSIVVSARKYGGPSATQLVITVEWVPTSGDPVVLGTLSPSSTSMANLTISSPASVTGNTTGSIKVSCKGASGGKGSGINKLTINYTEGNCGGSSKTLSSVAVSGTPTKTSYDAGENFNPAGLTVTGTYSDDSQAEITSGITWAYNPSQTLAENQTSIGVTATVGEITSAEYNVTELTVSEGPDVILDLLDEGWGFPTSKVVAETAYTNGGYTINVAGSTGNGFRVYTGQNILLGKQNAYIELPIFSSPIAKIVVAGNSGGSGATIWNIFQGENAVSTAATGCTAESYTFNIAPANQKANVAHMIKVISEHNLQIKSIKIYFGEAAAVEAPTISGDANFFTSTTVTITQADADAIYYTTDGSDPKTSGTKQTYTDSFTVDADGTTIVKAYAVKGSNESVLAEMAFTKATVMTVAQARAAIDAGGDLSNKYVAGIISQIDSYNSTYHSITYWISDDGTTTDQLEVYSGLAGVVKEQFASKDDLAVGDDVTVKGTLKKYNSTYEFDYNNTIEAYKPIARLAWSAESYDASLEGANTFPSLTNTNGVTVSYSSSDPTKASFADASVYEITLNAAGSTTITATFAGNETYKANSASYTLNVVSSLVTLTYNVDGGETIDPVNVSALPNPLPATTKAGKNFGGWFTDPEKEVAAVPGAAISENTTLYAKWLDPYTVAEAKTVIDAAPAGTANQYVAGIISQIDSYNSTYKSITYWISADGTTENQLQVYSGKIGNAATALGKEDFSAKEDLELGDEVVVTGTLKLHNSSVYEFDKNNTIYTFSRKASAGLEYAVTAVNKVVGDADFVNELTNPNSVAVTYATSDDQVAEVANDGTVTIIGEGSATITASFAGDQTYKAAEVSYTLTVGAAVLTDYYEKVTETAGIVEGTYLIVYEGESVAFDGGLDDSDNDHKLDKASNTIAVDITSDHKIGVTSATEAATFYIDPTAGTIQSASGKYIGVTSNSNGLKTSDNANAYTNSFAIDGDGNAIIGAVFSESTMTLRYNTDSGQKRFRYYKTTGSPAGQLYKLHGEVVKADPELAWSDNVEITVGGDFTSPTLSHAAGITGTITYSSDKETVATVDEFGVISVVADATGTAHITASYAGDENFKSGSAVCTIKVNPAHSIYVNKLNVNFGSVAKDATVDAIAVAVTLTNVDAATATLSGSGASAYSIDPAALTASGEITISVNTATAGTFNATLTISDDAGEAESKQVSLKLTVTDPAEEETPISTTSKWVAATAADLVDGAEVIITGVKDEVVYAMGEQKSTNRAAYVATVDGEGVLTPGEGTMSFTLVAQETEGVFALRTSDGKYLYAAASGSNHLKTQTEVDVNAQWTLTVASAVATGSSNRNVMQFNGSGTNNLFSCYSSASQTAIQLYVPKPVTPPTPVYETVRGGLTAGNYYTLCFNKTMTAIQGASLWSFAGKDANMAYIIEAEAPYLAGTPYLIYAESDKLEALTEEVDNPQAGDYNGLYGTFSYMSSADLDGVGATHMLKNNEIRPLGSNNHLDAYRAYIVLSEITNPAPASAPGKRVRAIPMHKDVVTGFENLNATDKPVKLMIDGNIYILRGEKMYDATGRLVK